MIEQLSSQVIDMIVNNDEINNKIQKKTRPFAIGGTIYFATLLVIVVMILIETRRISVLLRNSVPSVV
jgi:hypothetical protein